VQVHLAHPRVSWTPLDESNLDRLVERLETRLDPRVSEDAELELCVRAQRGGRLQATAQLRARGRTIRTRAEAWDTVEIVDAVEDGLLRQIRRLNRVPKASRRRLRDAFGRTPLPA